jgi:hypothetical protein
MLVKELGIDGKNHTHYKKFTVAATQMTARKWTYQLTDPNAQSLWEGGNWFSETSLSSF